MNIIDIINKTKERGKQLIEDVNTSFVELQKSIKTDVEKKVPEYNPSSPKGHIMQYAAIGLTAIGILGWINSESDSIWPKLSVGGGVVLFVLDMMRKGRKRNPSKRISYEEINVSLPKQAIQGKINSIATEVEKKWDKITDENKVEVYRLIEESSASDEEKFKATNIASLPRKIQFTILTFVSKILNAKSATELNTVLDEIRKDLKNNISDTMISQIIDYQNIAEKIQIKIPEQELLKN